MSAHDVAEEVDETYTRMLGDLLEGHTQERVASRFGVSRALVSHLVRENGDQERVREARDAVRRAERLADVRSRVEAAMANESVITLRDLIESARIHQDTLTDALSDEELTAINSTLVERQMESDRRAVAARKYDDDAGRRALRRVAELVDGSLTTAKYSELRREDEPSSAWLTQRGRWIDLLEDAGVAHGSRRRREYSRLTEAQILEQLDVFAATPHPPTSTAYDSWSREGTERPSLATVRNRLGRWSRAAAHIRERRQQGNADS